MPVAATTQQANADARSEAKAFAKENVHGLQPSSHGFTTLMLALFAILTDVTDDFVPSRKYGADLFANARRAAGRCLVAGAVPGCRKPGSAVG